MGMMIWPWPPKAANQSLADPDVAVIETADFGTIVIELYSNAAPQMAERLKKLIKEGFYNGTLHFLLNRSELGNHSRRRSAVAITIRKIDGKIGDSPHPNGFPVRRSSLYDASTVGAGVKAPVPLLRARRID